MKDDPIRRGGAGAVLPIKGDARLIRPLRGALKAFLAAPPYKAPPQGPYGLSRLGPRPGRQDAPRGRMKRRKAWTL
jgi:hypothetical protein